jgi:hypothetical protein
VSDKFIVLESSLIHDALVVSLYLVNGQPMSFRFAVPEIDASQVADLNPRRLQALVQEVDESDGRTAAQALNAFLHVANRATARTDDRLRALETLLPKAKHVLDELAGLYETGPLPLAGAYREAASAARTLQLELGYGYKRVLMEHTLKLTAEGQKALPFLLCRAMRALADSLVTAYCTYCPTPAGTWQEIHHIFHYAQFYGLDGSVVEELGPQRGTTLAAIYREVLLFALIDPYHLQAGEARTVLELVSHFQKFLVVEPYREVDQTDGVFLIQASQDKPPRALTAAGGAVISPMDKLLDTGRLVAELGASRRRSEAGDVAELNLIPVAEGRGSLHALLARIERHWSSPPRRNFPRTQGRHAVAVATGISMLAGAVAGADTEPLGGVETWQVANESPGGIALRREGSNATALTVGEVVGIRHPDLDNWQPGIVRWVHDQRDALLECGIQLLAPQCEVVSLQANEVNDGKPRLALWLPEMAGLARPPLLLAARGSFAPGRQYQIEGPKGRGTIRGLRLEDHTYQVELFEFEASTSS